MINIICPNCGFQFNAKNNRTYKGIWHDFEKQTQVATHKPPEKWIDISAEVKCPKCNKTFTTQAVKYFGLLSPKGMKFLFGFIIFSFLIFIIYTLYTLI